jgi:hypothetical protein
VGGRWRGWEQGRETAQTMYAHVNKLIKNKVNKLVNPTQKIKHTDMRNRHP